MQVKDQFMSNHNSFYIDIFCEGQIYEWYIMCIYQCNQFIKIWNVSKGMFISNMKYDIFSHN